MSARAQAQKENFNLLMGVGGSVETVHSKNRVHDLVGAIHFTWRQPFANKFFQHLSTEALSTSTNIGHGLLKREVIHR